MTKRYFFSFFLAFAACVSAWSQSLTISASTPRVCQINPQTVVLTAVVDNIPQDDRIGQVAWYNEAGTLLGYGSSISVLVSQTSSYSAVLEYVDNTELVNNGTFAIRPFQSGNVTTGLVYNTDVYWGGPGRTYLINDFGYSGSTLPIDHTTGLRGSCFYLIFPTKPGANLTGAYWTQSAIPVTAGRKYAFSFWGYDMNGIASPIINTRINGTTVGVNLPFSGISTWSRYYNVWTATSSTADISLFDLQTTTIGNDFLLDDISFKGILQATDDITISKGLPPSPVLTAALPVLCLGESTTITATGCSGTVNWSTGATGASISVTPTSTTSFTASCAEAGCTSAPSSVEVTVNPLPVAPTVTAESTVLCAGGSTTLTATGCAGTVIWSTTDSGNSLTVTPGFDQVYSAICTIANCNSDPTQITITVNPAAPAPTLTADRQQVCPYESVNLTASGCSGTVYWSTGEQGGAILAQVIGTTTFTAECEENGCRTSSDILITVYPSPGVPAISSDRTSICLGGSVVLTATGCVPGADVIWQDGQQGNTLTVSPTANASYLAQCFLNGCGDQPSNTIDVTVNPIPSAPVLSNMIVCAGSSAILTPFGCAGTVTTIDTQTAIVTGAFTNTVVSYTMVCTENSCVSPEGVGSITYLEIPRLPELTATAGTNGDKVCPGNAVTVAVTSCTGGSVNWSNGQFGDSVIFYPSAGNATFSVTCFNGSCQSETKPILFQQN